MEELLPKELIEDILSETGAFSPETATPVVRSVQNFKPFRIQAKPQEELDLALFSAVFDQAFTFVQTDWRKNFADGCTVSLHESGIMNLSKYRQREESLCVQLAVDEVPDAFLFFMLPGTLYFMLNSFFGGTAFRSAKDGGYLTDVELAVLERVSQSLSSCFSRAFHSVFPTRFKVARANVASEEQYEFMQTDFMLLDMVMNAGETKHHLAFAIPVSYLKYVKEQLGKRQSGELRKTDPNWQKLVADTVLSSEVEVNIGMGDVFIPFEKSVNLKPGDVLPWDVTGPHVVMTILDRPAMKGTIGAIGERYAIKVDEMLF